MSDLRQNNTLKYITEKDDLYFIPDYIEYISDTEKVYSCLVTREWPLAMWKKTVVYFRILTPAGQQELKEFPKYVWHLTTHAYARVPNCTEKKFNMEDSLDKNLWMHYVMLSVNKVPEFLLWYNIKYTPPEEDDIEWIHPVSMDHEMMVAFGRNIKPFRTYREVHSGSDLGNSVYVEKLSIDYYITHKDNQQVIAYPDIHDNCQASWVQDTFDDTIKHIRWKVPSTESELKRMAPVYGYPPNIGFVFTEYTFAQSKATSHNKPSHWVYLE